MSLRSWERSILCHLTLDFPTFRHFANLRSFQPADISNQCHHDLHNFRSFVTSTFEIFVLCDFEILTYWSIDYLHSAFRSYGISNLKATLYFPCQYHFDCLTFDLLTFGHFITMSFRSCFFFFFVFGHFVNFFWPSNFLLLCYQWNFGLYVNSVVDLIICHFGLWAFHSFVIWHLDLLTFAHFAEC